MKISHVALPLLGCLLLLLCAGCQCGTGYSCYSPGKWSSTQLGRVRVEVVYANDADEHTLSSAPRADVVAWTGEVLRTSPGVTVIDSAATALPPDSAPANTLCRITIGESAGYFSIGAAPPGWSLGRRLCYDVEIYDQATHARLFRAVRTVNTGGSYNTFPFQTAAELYKGDLARVFSPAGAGQ